MNRSEIYEALGRPGDVKDWLTRRLTSSEIGEAHSDCVSMKRKPGTPADWWHERAEAFAAQLESLRDGAEVWAFQSPPSTWEYRSGLCIVRNQDIVAVYIITMS